MATMTAREARQRFGALMDMARSEPVTITKHNRPSVVVISSERYAELEAIEDAIWVAKAIESEKSDLLSVDDTVAFLTEKMDTCHLKKRDQIFDPQAPAQGSKTGEE